MKLTVLAWDKRKSQSLEYVPRKPGTTVRQCHRVLIVVAVTVLYAVCFVAIKSGLGLAPPLRFAGLRVLIAGVALIGVVLIRREPLIPPRATWPSLLTLAIVASAVVYGAMFLSPGRTGAGIATVLGNTQALFTVSLAIIFLGERLTRWKVVALTLGLIGVTLVAFPELASPGAYGLTGAALALAAAAGSAIGNIIVKRLGSLPSLLAMTAWSFVLGSLPLLGVSLVFESGTGINWSSDFVGLLLFLALPGTALTTMLWYWLIQRSEVGQLTMFLFLVPIIGLVLATRVLGERIGGYEQAGVITILLGVGITTWEMRHPARPKRDVGITADTLLALKEEIKDVEPASNATQTLPTGPILTADRIIVQSRNPVPSQVERQIRHI